MRKLKKYFVDADNSSVLAMSLVEEPAIESNFIALAKDKKDYIALQSDEKHMLYGAALVPDFPIYRNDGTEEYYIQFSKEAVEKLSRDFIINGYQSNFTEAHRSEAEGITAVESWIKVDMDKDKSVALGLDPNLPVGTWFIGSKVNNIDTWQSIKEGKFNGYSIEAVCQIAEQENFEATEEPAATEETTVEETTVEEPTVEVKESVLDKILNLLTPSMAKKEEPKVEEPKVEEPKVEEPKTEEPKVEVPNPLEEVVKNLKDELEALKEDKEGLMKKVKELSSKPSAKPTNTNPNSKTSSNDAFKNWRETLRSME